jgi:hypothetical protein
MTDEQTPTILDLKILTILTEFNLVITLRLSFYDEVQPYAWSEIVVQLNNVGWTNRCRRQ